MKKELFKEFCPTFLAVSNNGNVLQIYRCGVDKEVIEKYKSDKDNRVKFIFFDIEYSDVSFDTSINEIHKFKSKYRGNSYIRIPLTFVKKEDNKYVCGIEVCSSDNEPDGYAVISKLDLITDNKKLKTASKAEKESVGQDLCFKKIYEYNSLLCGDVFLVKEMDNDNNCVSENVIYGLKELKELLLNNTRELLKELKKLNNET